MNQTHKVNLYMYDSKRGDTLKEGLPQLLHSLNNIHYQLIFLQPFNIKSWLDRNTGTKMIKGMIIWGEILCDIPNIKYMILFFH